MTGEPTVTLELDDIQAALVHPRPTRYAGAVLLVRIDDRRDGRELLRRLIPFIPSAAGSMDPSQVAWAAVGLSFQGLKALGVPEEHASPASRRSSSRAWPRGRPSWATPARARPSTGSNRSGARTSTSAIYALAPDDARLEARSPAPATPCGMCPASHRSGSRTRYMLPTERTSFGFKDGISNPAIEGSGIPGTNPHEEPLKAGEFVLGYPDENGDLPPCPSPRCSAATAPTSSSASCTPAWRRSASTCVHRAKSRAEEELLAAKFVGRWPSGAPLALAPDRDDPELGADPERNNAFLYAATTTRAASSARSAPTPGG